MAGNVKVNSFKNIEKEFKAKLLLEHKAALTQMASVSDKQIKNDLKQTLKHNEESGTGAFRNVNPLSTYQVRTTVNGAILTYHIVMQDGISKKPHYLWHLLNKGRKTGAAKSRIRFPVRNSTRTFPGSLGVTGFQGYTGEWRNVPKGRQIKGFDGRGWYELVKENLKKFLNKREYKVVDLIRLEHQD